MAELDSLSVLQRFPKERPPIGPKIARIHGEFYRTSRTGRLATCGVTSIMEAWMHRQVAGDAGHPSAGAGTTLEIGAGSLNHLPYEPSSTHYDIVEPFADLYRLSPDLGRVARIFPSIDAVPPSQRYDRIISIATFEHLCELPSIVARAGLLLAAGGTLRVAIPSEGTPLWKIGCLLSTGIEFRLRYGASYAEFLAHEHVNRADEIEGVLRVFFRSVQVKVCGLSRYWSFYQFFACTDPDLQRCRELAHG